MIKLVNKDYFNDHDLVITRKMLIQMLGKPPTDGGYTILSGNQNNPIFTWNYERINNLSDNELILLYEVFVGGNVYVGEEL